MGRPVTGVITDAQRAVLTKLVPFLEPGTYVAGGIAVASLLHHRASRDLDLFVPHDFDSDRLEERLAASPHSHDLRIVGRARGTLHLEVSGIPVSILSYRYPLLAATMNSDGLALAIASPEDLACMKVSAIAGRGAAKDFWDLDGLLKHGVAKGSLEDVLVLYSRKFPVEDVGHAVRSLSYFGDADAAPLPAGLSLTHWGELKTAFALRVKALPY